LPQFGEYQTAPFGVMSPQEELPSDTVPTLAALLRGADGLNTACRVGFVASILLSQRGGTRQVAVVGFKNVVTEAFDDAAVMRIYSYAIEHNCGVADPDDRIITEHFHTPLTIVGDRRVPHHDVDFPSAQALGEDPNSSLGIIRGDVYGNSKTGTVRHEAIRH
jgi:hypothetical protein